MYTRNNFQNTILSNTRFGVNYFGEVRSSYILYKKKKILSHHKLFFKVLYKQVYKFCMLVLKSNGSQPMVCVP